MCPTKAKDLNSKEFQRIHGGWGRMGKNRATRVRGIDNFTLTYGSQLYVSPPPVMS